MVGNATQKSDRLKSVVTRWVMPSAFASDCGNLVGREVAVASCYGAMTFLCDIEKLPIKIGRYKMTHAYGIRFIAQSFFCERKCLHSKQYCMECFLFFSYRGRQCHRYDLFCNNGIYSVAFLQMRWSLRGQNARLTRCLSSGADSYGFPVQVGTADQLTSPPTIQSQPSLF